MYIYQNGKLYIREDGDLIGVDIDSNGVTKIKGTETELDPIHDVCTIYEVKCRFHLDDVPYVFPREVGVVNEPVDNIKKPTRGRPRK